MRIITLILTSFLVLACTDEPDVFEYTVKIKNNSDEIFNIEIYNQDILNDNIILPPSESGNECSYTDENFRGYKSIDCQMDSVVIKFNNNKGYVSSNNTLYLSPFSFQNDNGLFGPADKFIKTNNNTYEFIVTQEDYENAHDLP